MSQRVRLSALLLLLGACTPSPSSGPAAAIAAAYPASGSLDLRDAPVTELVGQLAAAIGTPVTVDGAAVPLTRCAHVTLVAPPGTPRGQLISLATQVLRSSALSLTDAGDHLAVARIDDAEVPTDCARTVRPMTPRLTDPPVEPPVELLDVPPPVEGIRLIATDTYEVDPDAPVFADGMEGFTRAARLVPHMVDGQIVGLRLFGIRRDSMLGALGFRNGDIVHRVNDREVTSPEAALESYAELRSAQRIVVALERRGAPMTLTYVRRDAVRRAPGTAPPAAP